MTTTTHRVGVLLALLLAAVVVAGVALVGTGGLGALVERGEHLVHDESPSLRAPQGEYVRSVHGDRAVLYAVGDADGIAGARLARSIQDGHPDRLLYLGDVYEWGSSASFRAWARAWSGLAENTAPTIGNHDWPDASEGYEPFWTKVKGAPPPTYYAFRAAGWDVVSISSEDDHDAGSQQERWLRERVSAAPSACRIVAWHRPRFSAGPHGDEPSLDAMWRDLRGRARIVVSGHEHNSQRLRDQDGIVQFVAGAAGRELQAPDAADERIAFADATRNAALRLVLRPGAARWSFVDEGGRVLDAGTLRC